MSTAKPTVMLAVQPLYVARQEAAAMLSISETTLEQLVAKREAPAPTAVARPSDRELLAEWDCVSTIAKAGERRLAVMRAVLARWGAAPTAQAAPQQEVNQDTMYLLRRLLSNQHTLTSAEFREELTWCASSLGL